MVDNYSIQSHHLDHCQRSRNCVISKDDVGKATVMHIPSGKSHCHGKATVMDKETVGEVMWSWKEHEPSANPRQKECSPPSTDPPPKSRPARARPSAGGGGQSRPHSPFTEVIANRPGTEMETKTAARYAEYAQRDAKRRQPLRGKSTRGARLRTGSKPAAEMAERGGRWTMSRFKNVPSHFEQDRALLRPCASAPSLSVRDAPPETRAPAESDTSVAPRATASRQRSHSGAITAGTHQSVVLSGGLKWPHKGSSAAEPEKIVVSHVGTGLESLSEVGSEVPSGLTRELQSRVSASLVSGAQISSIERSSSLVAHPMPTSNATVRKSRVASAPARRNDAVKSAIGAPTIAVSKPGSLPSGESFSYAAGRPRTASATMKSGIVSEQREGTGARRPVSSGAVPVMKVAEFDASFVSDLWARHNPCMRGREVVESLRRRPHSASA